jgi:hypothetical protein
MNTTTYRNVEIPLTIKDIQFEILTDLERYEVDFYAGVEFKGKDYSTHDYIDLTLECYYFDDSDIYFRSFAEGAFQYIIEEIYEEHYAEGN